MGIGLALIAGVFTSLTNLFTRKGVDVSGSSKAFFICQIFVSAFFSILLGPIRNYDFRISLYPSFLGVFAGLVLAAMLFSLGKAIEKGPSGLTFAILNSATIIPGILMSLLFGSSFGFLYNFWHGIGSLLVLIGIFLGIKEIQQMKEMQSWMFFTILMFIFHVLLLCLYQYRSMLIKLSNEKEYVSEWFVPFMFFTCGCIQFMAYYHSKKTPLHSKEVLFGIVGGITNMLCTFFLLTAAKNASSLENSIIYPVFSVAGIVLTNVWSSHVYSERINWKANRLAILGIIIGTMNWDIILEYFK